MKIEEEEVLKLHNEGWNTVEIAKKTGHGQTGIERFLKRKNLPCSPIDFKGPMCWKWVEEIIYKYEVEKKSAAKIIKEMKLSITENSIITLVRKYGSGQIRKNGRIKADVDESFFEKIDSWEKAYILGWLYADGSICTSKNHKVISINLHAKDIDVLFFIKKHLKYEGRILYTRKRNHVYLSIHSDKIASDLRKYGVIERKSKTSYPHMEYINEEFQTDFMRGMIDGDGSASLSGVLNFCGNEETNKIVCEWFEKKGFNPAMWINKTTGVYYTRISKTSEAKKIYNLLWNNQKFCLYRKKIRICNKIRGFRANSSFNKDE